MSLNFSPFLTVLAVWLINNHVFQEWQWQPYELCSFCSLAFPFSVIQSIKTIQPRVLHILESYEERIHWKEPGCLYHWPAPWPQSHGSCLDFYLFWVIPVNSMWNQDKLSAKTLLQFLTHRNLNYSIVLLPSFCFGVVTIQKQLFITRENWHTEKMTIWLKSQSQ